MHRLPSAAELQPKRLIHRFSQIDTDFLRRVFEAQGQTNHVYVVVNLRNLSNLWIAPRRDFDPQFAQTPVARVHWLIGHWSLVIGDW